MFRPPPPAQWAAPGREFEEATRMLARDGEHEIDRRGDLAGNASTSRPSMTAMPGVRERQRDWIKIKNPAHPLIALSKRRAARR